MEDVLTTDSAIRASNVKKKYPATKSEGGLALDGFNLEVRTGSVHGLLGPNGAGKSTAIGIMSTLLDYDSGDVTVAGFDVGRQGRQVRKEIGLVGQYAAVDEELSGMQNLVMFGRLGGLTRTDATQRAGELLESFRLSDTGRKPLSAYSGGMRRRLDLAVSLIVAPRILFVDEPTTGLDPAARRSMWEAIDELVRAGTTVLLTTQYLEEADELADRVSMIAHGRVVAEGSPKELKARVGNDRIQFTLSDPRDLNRATEVATPWAEGQVHLGEGQLLVPVADRARSLLKISAAFEDLSIEVTDVSIDSPTLDDVFLEITGEAASTSRASSSIDGGPEQHRTATDSQTAATSGGY